jgi:VIT1/CCC1 family predicted Fe2+/Mn2+ transporter
VAAVSSFVTFSTGALVPLIPFLLGFGSLVAGLALGGLGLLVAGALAAVTTVTPWWLSAVRQLAFGGLAAGATYLVGWALGLSVVG